MGSFESNDSGIENKNEKITRLLVSKRLNSWDRMEDSNRKYWVSDMLLTRSDVNPGVTYYNLENFSNTKKMQIEIDGEVVELPPEMMRQLEAFFKIQLNISEPFDCGSFAHMLNSLDFAWPTWHPSDFVISELKHNWLLGYSSDLLVPGDTVFIGNSKDSVDYDLQHWAIYIGKGLYISKFGSGRLVVTNLKNLFKAYRARYAFKAIPRRK